MVSELSLGSGKGAGLIPKVDRSGLSKASFLHLQYLAEAFVTYTKSDLQLQWNTHRVSSGIGASTADLLTSSSVP